MAYSVYGKWFNSLVGVSIDQMRTFNAIYIKIAGRPCKVLVVNTTTTLVSHGPLALGKECIGV